MRKIILASILSVLTFSVNAQIDTINAANNKLQIQNLKEGESTYLVYSTDTLFKKRNIGQLWQRSTKKIDFKNKPAIEFIWKTIHKDTLYATVTNICDAKTLAPIYHHETSKYKGKSIMAYNFTNGFMTIADTVQNNMASNKVQLTIPILSWEHDIETYPLLPIKKIGQILDISFFDPNEKNTQYRRYEVAGKEYLRLNSETNIKCWILKIKYANENYATIWLTEKNKELLKIQEYYKGRYRIVLKQY